MPPLPPSPIFLIGIYRTLEIRLFPSEQFYHGLLIDSDNIKEEVLALSSKSNDSQALPKSWNVVSPLLVSIGIRPISFFDISRGVETRVGKSLRNDAEIAFIIEFLEGIYEHLRREELTVAIITPYKAQMHRLADVISKKALFTTETRRSIEINTVDGFQGKEKDVVIFSCVRAGMPTMSHRHANNGGKEGPKGTIGFVADERRMNVALTRARKALVIVGSREKLQSDSLWSSLLESLANRGMMRVERDLHR